MQHCEGNVTNKIKLLEVKSAIQLHLVALPAIFNNYFPEERF
jgi:hypothetical protein